MYSQHVEQCQVYGTCSINISQIRKYFSASPVFSTSLLTFPLANPPPPFRSSQWLLGAPMPSPSDAPFSCLPPCQAPSALPPGLCVRNCPWAVLLWAEQRSCCQTHSARDGVALVGHGEAFCGWQSVSYIYGRGGSFLGCRRVSAVQLPQVLLLHSSAPTISQNYVSVFSVALRPQKAVLNRKSWISHLFRITCSLISKNKCHISFSSYSESISWLAEEGVELERKQQIVWGATDFFFLILRCLTHCLIHSGHCN